MLDPCLRGDDKIDRISGPLGGNDIGIAEGKSAAIGENAERRKFGTVRHPNNKSASPP
jgi:hypothetical protein